MPDYSLGHDGLWAAAMVLSLRVVAGLNMWGSSENRIQSVLILVGNAHPTTENSVSGIN